MPIKNYTTTVDIYQSISEIQCALMKAGADKIVIDCDGGRPASVTFGLNTARGLRGFLISAHIAGTERVFRKQNLKINREQIERTAWRNIRDWVLAQVALVESEEVPLDEVFLQYLTDGKGTTLYQLYESGRLPLLLAAEEQ